MIVILTVSSKMQARRDGPGRDGSHVTECYDARQRAQAGARANGYKSATGCAYEQNGCPRGARHRPVRAARATSTDDVAGDDVRAQPVDLGGELGATRAEARSWNGAMLDAAVLERADERLVVERAVDVVADDLDHGVLRVLQHAREHHRAELGRAACRSRRCRPRSPRRRRARARPRPRPRRPGRRPAGSRRRPGR